MMFFRRAEVTVRIAHRGLTLSVPDRDRLLDACDPDQRRRLQRCLGEAAADEPPWEVQWQKMPGDALEREDVVVTLHRDGVVVELTYAQRGTLAEWLVTRGATVGAGGRLGLLERRAKTPPAPVPPAKEILRQFVARQRRDAATITSLQAQLTALEARLAERGPAAGDAKFRRLKLEFSKRFHPDARPPGDAEREHRARVFQEFWPIVEEIERS
ncbi:MAG TPA: biotin/lipoyl-containing protein [Stellaceae bacterium]|nr:biotin/lipoyl-containing protein [Stellaceae bacterium]